MAAAPNGSDRRRSSRSPPLLPEVLSSLPGDTSKDAPTARSRSSLLQDLASSDSHLILHFDINETILVGDDAGGDTREDCLNKMLAKSAFVRMPPSPPSGGGTGEWRSRTISETEKIVPTHWWDGTPIIGDLTSNDDDHSHSQPPPLYTGFSWPPNSCPYYRTSFKRRAKSFTEPKGDGRAYRPLYEELERRLNLGDRLMDSEHGIERNHPFHHMLPAFFRTLRTLTEVGRRYTLVLRTFGSDLDDIAGALTDFAKGRNPEHLDYHNPDLELGIDDMFRGRWKPKSDGGGPSYELHCHDRPDEVVVSGDDLVMDAIERRTVLGIQDDYKHWSANGCSPSAGKPVWIRAEEEQNRERKRPYRHHIFFDDNIHNDPTDSIVAVRCVEVEEDNGSRGDGSAAYRSLTGLETIGMHGRHLIKVPTVEPILNEDWFLMSIVQAEKAVRHRS